MENLEIRQIFYNMETLSQTPSSFIPIDNVDGDKSWFEFWPILNFLKNTKIEENVFYGFLSPSFTEKTGISSESVINAVKNNSDKDVLLFSFAWDQLAYFLNPWEQGEVYHPGITKYTQDFLDYLEMDIKISNFVTSKKNSVFSNYVVAKKPYWDSWKTLATLFLTYTKDVASEFNSLNVKYKRRDVPLKVFIQERLPALLLADKKFSVACIDVAKNITCPLFIKSYENKNWLEECERIKNDIFEFGSSKYMIDELINIRKNVLWEQKYLYLLQ